MTDRDQIKRHAEETIRTVKPDDSYMADGVLTFARHCLALLTELEQAEEHVAGLSADLYDAQTLRSEAEHRLAKTPALVEALRQRGNLLVGEGLWDHADQDGALATWEQNT